MKKVQGGIKFNMKRVTQKPSSVFNRVIFLGSFRMPLIVIQTVNLNGKYKQ